MSAKRNVILQTEWRLLYDEYSEGGRAQRIIIYLKRYTYIKMISR